MPTINRSYKFLLKPTQSQRLAINEQLNACTKVKTLFVNDYINGIKQSALAKECLDIYISKNKDLLNCERSALINTIFKLQDKIKANENLTISKVHSYRSRCLNSNFSAHIVDDNHIYLPYVGSVKAIMYRELPSNSAVVQIIVSKERDNNYYGIIIVKFFYTTIIKDLDINNSIGFDYSSRHLIVDSNGNKYQPPHAFEKNENDLIKLQKDLSSHHNKEIRECKRIQIAKSYKKIFCQRNDYLHKLSHQISNKYDYVFVEDLDMNEIAHRKTITKTTYDNSYGYFLKLLEYKLAAQGKKLIRISKWYPSSKTCHKCGFINKTLSLEERMWTCPECGTIHDRDINAAINIREEGKRIVYMP